MPFSQEVVHFQKITLLIKKQTHTQILKCNSSDMIRIDKGCFGLGGYALLKRDTILGLTVSSFSE